MTLVLEIHKSLGLSVSEDEEVRQFKEPTHVTHLVNAVDEAEREIGGAAADSPDSAVDTEH